MLRVRSVVACIHVVEVIWLLLVLDAETGSLGALTHWHIVRQMSSSTHQIIDTLCTTDRERSCSWLLCDFLELYGEVLPASSSLLLLKLILFACIW